MSRGEHDWARGHYRREGAALCFVAILIVTPALAQHKPERRGGDGKLRYLDEPMEGAEKFQQKK